MQLCQEVVPDTPICIALNKSDMENSSEYCVDELKNIAPNIISIHKTSAKLGEEINEIFTNINSIVIKKR